MRDFKLALLILALLPTFTMRSAPPLRVLGGNAAVQDLMPALRREGHLPDISPLQLVGAWHLTSPDPGFGSFSGLAQSVATLVSVSDRGRVLWFSPPDRPGIWHSRLRRLINADWRKQHFDTDAESVAINPHTGDLLVGYEGAGAMQRFSADLAVRTAIPLPVLREWPANQGPEAMTTLTDGRTVMIGEAYARWFDRTRHTGLIYKEEPRADEVPARFELQLPAGYRPTEMAQMPDGRLLVLGRNFSFAGFRSVIASFAPADLRARALITPHVVAHIADARIRDNYEGMTVTRDSDGSTAIWLMSDNNEMVWVQRTIVLKLRMPNRL